MWAARGGLCIAVPVTTVTWWSKSPGLPAFEIGVNLIALCLLHLFDIYCGLVRFLLPFVLSILYVLRRSGREDVEDPEYVCKRCRRRARGATLLASHNWP